MLNFGKIHCKHKCRFVPIFLLNIQKLKGYAELTSCDLQIPIGAFKFGTNAVDKFCSDFERFHRGDMLQVGKVNAETICLFT